MWAAVVVAAGTVLVFSSCDSVPGVPGGEGTPPLLSDVEFTPAFVDIASIPAEQRTDTTLIVPFSVQATATDFDGDLLSVAFVVQDLVAGNTPILQGAMTGTGTAFSGGGDIVVPVGTIANYSVLVYAVDEQGHVSNRARGQVRFVSSDAGGPPVIEDVESDPPIVRPGATGTTFRLIAVVSDPDGLANVLRVEGTAPNGSKFDLRDDGESFGDDVAGDGRFTTRFDVPPSCDLSPPPCVSPSTQVFRIQAFDRSGLTSEVFEKEVTIE